MNANDMLCALQNPLHDYYCAATVRLAGAPKEVTLSLWTRHIQAADYAVARDAAKKAIAELGLEWSALDVLSADATVMVIR